MKKVLFVVYLFFVSSLYAQQEYNQLYFKRYEVEDGLSQSWVQCITQDYMGFMWFGSADGLNRFDGYNFKVYKHNPKSNKSLKNNNITRILEDNQHNLWVATSTGLCLFKREYEEFCYPPEWPEIYITDIITRKKNLLIGSDQGLFYLNTESMKMGRYKVNNRNLLTDPYISCLKTDYHGHTWIGTLDGLFLIDSTFKNVSKFKLLNTPDGMRISTIATDSDSNVWVGTETRGLFKIHYNTKLKNYTVEYHYKADHKGNFSEGFIRAIREDKCGRIWIGIENAGLVIINNSYGENNIKHIKAFKYDPKWEFGLSSNSIFDIYKDNDDNLWLGTYGGGINFYNHGGINFHLFRHSPQDEKSLVDNNVNVFYEYNDKIYIGTQSGLSIFDPNKGNFLNFPEISSHNGKDKTDAIWAITSGKDKDLWIGTWAGGVSRFNPASQKYEELEPDILSYSNVFSILEDNEGTLWIATMGGGLLAYNKSTNKFKKYLTDINNPFSISNNWVRQIYENSKNELWISTASSVDLFDRKMNHFIHFNSNIYDTTTISGRGAYIIFEDSRNNMWFGTDAGLNYFVRKDSSFIYYQEDNGLPNNSVKAILEDSHGNLWISTNRGISKMKNGIYTPVNPEFQNFDVSDGLQGNEFNRRSAFRTKDGIMYFGGTNGFNVFHPDSLHQNTTIPKVVFTNLMVSNQIVEPSESGTIIKKHISVADEITIKYSQSVFTIEYTALNYINSNKNQYAYMLEGFDKTWNKVGTKRTANYTNINPGEYTFKVIASNNDDFWNTTGAQIKISILPPWYRTNLAYLFYIVFIAFLVYALRRLVLMRVKLQHEIELKQLEKEKLDEVHKVKTRFFTNISHEFRTPLTLIISPLEKILNTVSFQADINQQFQVMLKNARRMLRLINQFMDMSKIEAGYLKMAVHEGNMAKYIRTISEIFSYQAKEKNIKYEFVSSHESLIGWFDSDKIEKILYNLLSNAIKFTPEHNKVSFKVKFNPENKTDNEYKGFVEFWVEDSGIGMKPDEREKIFTRFYQSDNAKSSKYSGTGIGLSLVQGLVQKYGGVIEFNSEYEKGSVFYVRLPFARHFFKEDIIIYKTEEEYLSNLETTYTPLNLQEEGVKIQNSTVIRSKPVMLIVEDNVDLINYLSDFFDKNFNVINAVNGREGIDIAQKNNPAIIISDIMMPDTDGIELCKALKSDEQTSHIPIILLTAKASNETHIEGLETGADSFLPKPFNIEVLNARVTNLLESRKKLREKFAQKINIEPKDISITSVDAAFMKKAMDLVERNLSNTEFSTEIMSRELGMSRATLHRKLIALTDMPPSSFIRALRMKRAARLLVEGQKTVSEVLYDVGIKSRSYFTKSFKETYGMSPTEYVDQEKKKSIDHVE